MKKLFFTIFMILMLTGAYAQERRAGGGGVSNSLMAQLQTKPNTVQFLRSQVQRIVELYKSGVKPDFTALDGKKLTCFDYEGSFRRADHETMYDPDVGWIKLSKISSESDVLDIYKQDTNAIGNVTVVWADTAGDKGSGFTLLHRTDGVDSNWDQEMGSRASKSAVWENSKALEGARSARMTSDGSKLIILEPWPKSMNENIKKFRNPTVFPGNEDLYLFHAVECELN